MEKITQFFIGRKMLVDVLLLLIVVLGITSVMKSRKEGFPEISMNKLVILTIYPGASAKDVELNVTLKIEEELKEVEGIKEILSYSEESVSRIEVQGLEGLKSEKFRRLFTDIENAISKIDDFPRNLKGKPTVTEITTSDMPILELAYTGDYKNLKPYLESLKVRLRKVSGVSGVDLVGLPDEEVHIYIDPEKARKNFLDLRAIANAIRYRNTEGSGGIIETSQGERKVVMSGKFKDYKDVLETDLLTNEAGFRVKLKDVATIQLVPEDLKLLVRNNGERGSVLSIKKIGSADLLNTVDSIETLLANEDLPQGVVYKKLFDQSILTRNRINLLIGNSVMGFALVLLVLLYFLNFHTAFWTAMGIPVALFGMLIFLKLMDISLNLISLAGFIIIIGMLVDDAVVIAEEYNTNRENGIEPNTAVVQAVSRMWAPVLASSLTTMIAFAPLFMVGGFPGAFIWTIPLMVIVGLSVSLLESFVMLPSHLVSGKPKKHTDKKIMVLLEKAYRATLKVALANRYKVLLLFLVCLVVSMVVLRKVVKKDPFPQDAAEGFSISLTLPLGATAKESEIQLVRIENVLSKLPKEEILGFSTRIGTQSQLTYQDRGNQNNLAIIFVYLTPYQERKRNANQIIEFLQSELKPLSEEFNFQFSIFLKRIGPPMGRDIEVRVISNNDEIRFKKLEEIEKFLKNINGVYNIETEFTKSLSKKIFPSMKAFELQNNFGLENLKLIERPEPKILNSNDVLIKIKATSLNFRDYLVVTGKYNPKFKLPFVPLSDGAGEVLEVGSSVTDFKTGDRVILQFAPKWLDGDATYEQSRHTLGGPLDGTLMEKKVYPDYALVKIPNYMNYEEAATLPCAALTSWSSLVTYGRIFPGDTVVVLGTGGVSIFALQIAKFHGAKVIVTSGSDEKLEQAKSLGADHVINYKTNLDWGKKVKEITGTGADHIIEVGGAGTLEQSIKAIRPFGQISLIGILAGGAKDLNLLPVLMNNIKLQGILVGSKSGLAAMCKAFDFHKTKPIIDKVFPFEESVQAIEYLKSGNHFGKIVISL